CGGLPAGGACAWPHAAHLQRGVRAAPRDQHGRPGCTAAHRRLSQERMQRSAELRPETGNFAPGGRRDEGGRAGPRARALPIDGEESMQRHRMVAVRCGSLVPLLALTGCDPGILPSLGAVGKGDTTIMIDSLAIMLAIVVPTIAAILAFAWWFRSSNSSAHR